MSYKTVSNISDCFPLLFLNFLLKRDISMCFVFESSGGEIIIE